jgi:DNA-binding IclR family transcriptional regulator
MKLAIKLFSVLETLCITGEAGVNELSIKLGLGKSSIHRFLSVLRDLGYVEKNQSNEKYFATLKVFKMGSMVRGRIGLAQLVRPYMEELGRQFHETINLALLEEGEVVYIDKVESAETLRMDLAVGRHVPPYCTALGKVFLAALPADELDSYLHNRTFKTFTAKTITSEEDLRKCLESVKKEGIAIDDKELDEGIRCIAAPIRNEFGTVIAAISIAGPSMRMSMERLRSLREPMLRVTGEISEKLGYMSPCSLRLSIEQKTRTPQKVPLKKAPKAETVEHLSNRLRDGAGPGRVDPTLERTR